MKNYYKIYIRNLNKEKVINYLIKKHQIFKTDIVDNNFTFCCKPSDVAQICEYLYKNNIKIIRIETHGIVQKIKDKLNFGIALSIVFAILFCIINSFFILKIDVICEDDQLKSAVYSAISYVKPYTIKSNINTKEIEQKLYSNDKISFVSVSIKANTLVVNVKKKISNYEYDNKENFQPIISAYSGKITSVHIFQGTPAVTQNQYVNKGDVLVYPYVYDGKGNKMYVNPIAEITAEVYFTKCISVSEKSIQCIRTGNYYVEQSISLLGITISEKKSDFTYNYCDKVIEENFLMDGFLIPVKKTQITFYEVEQKMIENNFNENIETYKQQAKQECLESIDKNINIHNDYFYITNNNGINYVSYTAVSILRLA